MIPVAGAVGLIRSRLDYISLVVLGAVTPHSATMLLQTAIYSTTTSNNLVEVRLIAFILLKSPCAQLTSCKYSFQGCVHHVAAHIDSLADRCLSWLEVLMPMLIIGRSCAKLLIAVRLLLHNYDV